MSRVYEAVDAAYAAACSDGTLCSGARGFFRGLAEEMVAAAAADGALDALEAAPPAAKLAAVLENKQLMEALGAVLARIEPLRRGKDARVAQQRRQAAASALAVGQLRQALALAGQAVLRAPPTGSDEAVDGGVSLALALWQRSEALMAAGRARAALADLRLALRERLPARMRALYYRRMGHCYKAVGEPSRAKVSYELAARLAGDAAARDLIAADIDGLDFSAKPQPPPRRPGIALTGGAKQNMPALSSLLRIAEEEDKGRFAVAASEVRTGDILLVDSPYAACLLSDYYGTHCLHCFKRLGDCEDEAPVWCPKCSGVAFCSVQCRDTAVNSYHMYECPFLDLFIGSGMSILSHIALRMVTQAGLETSLSIHSKYITNEVKTVEGSALNDIEGVAKKSKMKSRKERLNRSKKGLRTLNEKNSKEEDVSKEEPAKVDDKVSFEESLEMKAAQVYSLCAHSEHRKGEDYLKRIVMGLFLTECLKKAGFFTKCSPENLETAERSVCELIVRNLQLLQFNAHEIYETLHGRHLFTGSKPLYIAVGIYPTGALFNHECYPAVARYFEGRKIVLRATRPLAPGDVVSENYGPHFLTRSLPERLRSLTARYWFRCECAACREDWPTLKQMTSDTAPYLRCPNLSCPGKFRVSGQMAPGRCGRCSTHIDRELVKISLETVDRCVEQYQEGARLIEKERVEEATAALSAGVDMFHAVARSPHRDTHLAQEALRSCFAARGNIHCVCDDADDAPPNNPSNPSTLAIAE